MYCLPSFPSNSKEALTMLYLEKQQLDDITPIELAKKYKEILKEISDYLDNNFHN